MENSRFEPPIGGLVATYDDQHWKARSGLPNNVNWTFSVGVTDEALRANIVSKSAISLQLATVGITRSSATAKSTARPSCLVGVLYDISREKICW